MYINYGRTGRPEPGVVISISSSEQIQVGRGLILQSVTKREHFFCHNSNAREPGAGVR